MFYLNSFSLLHAEHAQTPHAFNQLCPRARKSRRFRGTAACVGNDVRLKLIRIAVSAVILVSADTVFDRRRVQPTRSSLIYTDVLQNATTSLVHTLPNKHRCKRSFRSRTANCCGLNNITFVIQILCTCFFKTMTPIYQLHIFIKII